MIYRGMLKEVGDGEITLSVPSDLINKLLLSDTKEIELMEKSKGKATSVQLARIHCLISDIATSYKNEGVTSIDKEELKNEFKRCFKPIGELGERVDMGDFSLADINSDYAWQFIEHLELYCLEEGIETKVEIENYCDDIEKWAYVSASQRLCAVCKKPHSKRYVTKPHDNHVGIISLCDKHSEEYKRDRKSFMELYHLEMLKLSDEEFKKFI